jgi:choline dehydrogenase-like flavoprotein
MGHSPAVSVVNADCRLHAVPNLYVAGSSVFPTSGYANPTATIVALSIRLAEHLGTVMAHRVGSIVPSERAFVALDSGAEPAASVSPGPRPIHA